VDQEEVVATAFAEPLLATWIAMWTAGVNFTF